MEEPASPPPLAFVLSSTTSIETVEQLGIPEALHSSSLEEHIQSRIVARGLEPSEYLIASVVIETLLAARKLEGPAWVKAAVPHSSSCPYFPNSRKVKDAKVRQEATSAGTEAHRL
eukprot:CAMPEP_0178437262 /NCGR_PEP_ID=MMETSP0689_2-20121128/34890_1 /TAXON_ID=160604 /ORGANISM="Amphidinium massartii, Strain CS-259" /LENGTH=115 /DNA_ID=CAMNT_0020059435 /DNA_START=514 /DNA_END=860 /DNA_ORIENTATION=-